MSSYKEPSWAQLPPPDYQWHLVEAKSGVEVAKHVLHERKCTVLGRALDMVHIPLNHESASRQHARIAFDAAGIPWLRDLKSTHGTFCNKRTLPAQAIGKIESNSHQTGTRGVILYPGDVLQFGGSTRIFCVEGPAEYERGAKKFLATETKSSLSPSSTKSNRPNLENQAVDEKDDGVSWGITMEDEEEQSTPEATAKDKTLAMDIQVPEKHRKALERLNALKYKLANIQTEDERIRRKGELTDGQERQLQRNKDREDALVEKISELEQDLHSKLHPEQKLQKRIGSRNKPNDPEDDDVDDFYDRTKVRPRNVVDADGESEKSLTAKWKKAYQEYQYRAQKSIPQAQQNHSSLTEHVAKLKAAGDEEAFYVQNDLEIAEDVLKKLHVEHGKTQNAMKEIEDLLRIVNPKIVADRKTGYIGAGPQTVPSTKDAPPENLSSTMMPPPLAPKQDLVVPQNTSSIGGTANDNSMPPPAIPCKTVGPNNSDRIMPPPKRKRTVGPSMPPPKHPIDASGDKNARVSQRGAVEQPRQVGTLSILPSLTRQAHEDHKETMARKKDDFNKDKTLASDPQKDNWRPPQGQDGSGITKLNAKFGGRY